MKVFAQKIADHKLEMKPIDIDCTFDGSKILFISRLKAEWISESL